MKILAIETSCDETAVSLIETKSPTDFTVLGTGLNSQAKLHEQYGGVYPTLAKREHAQNLVPMLMLALTEAGMLEKTENIENRDVENKIREMLGPREEALLNAVQTELYTLKKPNIDAIAVTVGPGLEPALWVGINFAKTLSILWDTPVIPVNHMEGHLLSILSPKHELTFPALALLISGGHTEIIQATNWGVYKKIGQTRDDAVGEAFDKVARVLGLPYPGGPEISARAEHARKENLPQPVSLPRPMLSSGDYDFSFSGLKTAVLYATKDKTLTPDERDAYAREFEDAVTQVLIKKLSSAIEETGATSVIIAGGVSANTHIRRTLTEHIENTYHIPVHIPDTALATDNAVMIGLAGFMKYSIEKESAFADIDTLKADGNLSL